MIDMIDIIDSLFDATFEAVYIFCWFSFLGTIFYEVYVLPLNNNQILLYSFICKIRNILFIDKDSNKQIKKQLTDIQCQLQKLINQIEKYEMDKENETQEENEKQEKNNDNLMLSKKHILFPHFMIYSSKMKNCKESYLLSYNLSNFLGLNSGTTCTSIDSIKNIFIDFVKTNNFVKNDELIMAPIIKELFGILDDNCKLKLTDCESYLKPHLKNKTKY